ncbi:hypothetical protein T02_4258 [Trichinella nativa]|uniref:Uncharacterized protein n=1 Tax=Trichinella nativa TaxID=6335 RepID=A0A0V1LL25_9BILA|nr:hypothetical protein T02_4258 [Trichinella nativa]
MLTKRQGNNFGLLQQPQTDAYCGELKRLDNDAAANPRLTSPNADQTT